MTDGAIPAGEQGRPRASAAPSVPSGHGDGFDLAVIDSGWSLRDVAEFDHRVELRDFTGEGLADPIGHGTAHTMVATSGILAPLVVASAKVVRHDDHALTPALCDAIRWVLGRGVRVISIGLGTHQPTAALREMISRAVACSIVVAPVGNDRAAKMGRPMFPASHPGVLGAAMASSPASVGADRIVSETRGVPSPPPGWTAQDSSFATALVTHAILSTRAYAPPRPGICW